MNHRNTHVLSFSVLPKEARLIKRAAKERNKTLSDFLREAAKQTIAAYQWKKWCRKGEASARRLGFSPEDVESLIDDLRS